MTRSDRNPGERIVDVEVDDRSLGMTLADGRTIRAPLEWFPRLAHATADARANWRLCGGGFGVHWPDVDEDVSSEGLLRRARSPEARTGSRKP